ncbi:hypothetical protein [Leisingera caerulea]|uniref:Uncharacterized protein n=1 Tax=Leisingera caerulea TaxID=506591 RepID=A0A9Q9M1V9_LEICA|nr:hypothetical protein [Leisingera caerulea]UWQ54997.1 hypothetical protein K3721_05540 [Leisingera caerulea]
MDDQTIPADPFACTATAEQPEQDNSYSADAVAVLKREILAETLDSESDKRDPERWTTSGRWSELDRLALSRAAIWIAHADGYGIGITEQEAADLSSRDQERIAPAARRIVRRLSETVTAPDADATAVTCSEALSGLLPDINT